jgi:GNAT superfamily N-acetyltransferase
MSEDGVAEIAITEWACRARNGGELDREVEMLAEVLHAAVQGGASVNFVLPFSMEDAREFWRGAVMPQVEKGNRRVLVARCGRRIMGTVQLALAPQPNQRHRADVMKLLVHPEARRRGIGRALMLAVETVAREEERTLLTLDTRTGDKAEPLYTSLGYVMVGVIPRYSRAADAPVLEAATFFYKELEGTAQEAEGTCG